MSELPKITIGAHPRARRSVRRARSFGGLIAFAVTLVLSLKAGVPSFDATARALIAGIVVHLACWRVAVAVWHQLMLAELVQVREKREAHAQQRADLARAGVDA